MLSLDFAVDCIPLVCLVNPRIQYLFEYTALIVLVLLLSALEGDGSWVEHLIEAFFLYLGVFSYFVGSQVVLPASPNASIHESLMRSLLRTWDFQLTSLIRRVIGY